MSCFRVAYRGDTVHPPSDKSEIYKSKKNFWLGPFMLLRPGDIFYFDCDRVIRMPCGYDPSSDVDMDMDIDGINKMISDGWIEKVK